MRYKFFFSVIFFFSVLEFALRLNGFYNSFEEKQGLEYEIKYKKNTSDWFHTWAPNVTIIYKNSEFKYINKYNNWGHRELPIRFFLEDQKRVKVACIGDSFTEGDGAPYDSSWVKGIEHLLSNKNNKYLFYNAGACGSDVFFDYKMLTCKLIKLKPKIVLATLNYSDVFDVIYRGGDERFNSDSTTTYKAGPNWEWAYQYSHVIRLIVNQFLGFNYHFIKRNDELKAEVNAIKLIKKKVIETYTFCKKNGIEYYLIIHPHPLEINLKSNKLTETLANEPFVINLFNDLYPYYKKNNIANYYWPKNLHFNSKGYFVMSNKIASHLLTLSTFNTNIEN